MGCTIVFVILLVIGIGILCFLTGDMTAFIALAATLVIGLGLAGILYHIYKSKQRRMEKYNPLSPTLRWMNAAGSILIAASQHTNFHLLAGWRYNNEFDRESIKTMLWDYWGIQGHETAIKEMRSLIDEGMRASYRRKMELLSHKYKDATEVQLIEEARKTNPKADEASYLPKMLTAWRRYGENAPVRLGYGTLRIYHAMLLSGRLHQYEGNVGFVCRCRDKGAGFFSELGRNDGELSAGRPVLAA